MLRDNAAFRMVKFRDKQEKYGNVVEAIMDRGLISEPALPVGEICVESIGKTRVGKINEKVLRKTFSK